MRTVRRALAVTLAAAAISTAGAGTADARGWTSVRSVGQSTAAVMVVMRDGTTVGLSAGGDTLHERSEPRVVQVGRHTCVKVSVDGRPWRQLRSTTRQFTPVEDVTTRLRAWPCR